MPTHAQARHWPIEHMESQGWGSKPSDPPSQPSAAPTPSVTWIRAGVSRADRGSLALGRVGMAALAGGQPQAPAGSPVSSSRLLKHRDTLRFPCGSLSLSVAQFRQPICVRNEEGIRMGEKTPASSKAGFAPQKKKNQNKSERHVSVCGLSQHPPADVATPGGCC